MSKEQEKSLDSAVTGSMANDECVEATSSANNIAETKENNNGLSYDDKIVAIEIEKNKAIAIATFEDLIKQIKNSETNPSSAKCVSNKWFRENNQKDIKDALNIGSNTKFCKWLCEKYIYEAQKSVYVANDFSIKRGYYINFDEIDMCSKDYKVNRIKRGYITKTGQDHLQEVLNKMIEEQQDDGE